MDSIAVHGWQAPLVVESGDEMYGMTSWGFLPSMDIPSIHGWRISMSGMQHIRDMMTLSVTKCPFPTPSQMIVDVGRDDLIALLRPASAFEPGCFTAQYPAVEICC